MQLDYHVFLLSYCKVLESHTHMWTASHFNPNSPKSLQKIAKFFDTLGQFPVEWLYGSRGPLSLLINLQLPLVNLLQAVSWPSVVLTDPGVN